MRKYIGFLILVILFEFGPTALADEPLMTVINQKHSPYAFSLDFSPDGKYLITGGSDHTVKIWDLESSKLIKTLHGHIGDIQSVKISPDGKYIASGEIYLAYGKAEIKIWEMIGWKLIRTLRTYSDVLALAFSPNGNYLASGGWGNNLEIWNFRTGELIRRIAVQTAIISSVDFSQDGKLLALAGGEVIEVYKTTNWNKVKNLGLRNNGIKIIQFSHNGKYLASGGIDKTVRIWKVKTGKLLLELKGHKKGVISVNFSPDDIYLASGDDWEIINIWQVRNGKLVRTIKGLKWLWSLDWSPNDKYLASGSENIDLWDAGSGKHIKTLGESYCSWVNAIDYSPDGKYLALGGLSHVKDYKDIELENGIYILDINNAKLIKTLKGHQGIVNSLNYSHNGKYLVSGSGDKTIKIWDINTGKVIKSIEAHKTEATCVKFSHNGEYIVSGGCDDYDKNTYQCVKGLVKLWKFDTGELIKTFDGHNKNVTSVTFSPNGSYIVSTGDNSIKVWEFKRGVLAQSFKERLSAVTITFSSDGNYLATGSYENIKVFDANNWIPLKVFRLPSRFSQEEKIYPWDFATDGITSLDYSIDGKKLLFGNADGLVGIWNTQDATVSMVGKIHDRQVKSVKFCPDGKYFVSASWDGIKLMDSSTIKLNVELYQFADTFLALTPEGFFSGTGDFNKHVHFVKGLEVYDFNQFYDAFYRPDLVEKKLKGEDISEFTGGLNIKDAIKKPPPKVTILSPKEGDSVSERTVTVKVQIIDIGGAIGDIRVHHNGKLVDSLGVYRLAKPETADRQIKLAKADTDQYQSKGRGTALRRVTTDKNNIEIKTIDFKPITGTVEKTYTISLIKGENTISVSAFNGTNTVMSAMESIKINADIPERKPEIYVLSIGNNNFSDVSLNLKNAKKDAEDFSGLLKNIAAPLYDKTHIQTLIDAKKSDVVEAIYSICSQMKPEDIFILFAASHGRAEDDIYYLYTSDFDGNIRNGMNSISSVELMELSKRIPALKQIFILDTCQSGGMENIVSGLYDARISVLAKALGMHIFAGAKTYQEAQDIYQENGLFTHFVLNGLKGMADVNKNKEVTVLEMNPYLASKVKEASGGMQEPFIRNYGDDLPLAKVIYP